MKRLLIIRSQLSEADFRRAAAEIGGVPDLEVRTLDLNEAEPDYGGLVEAVFAADAAQVW